MDCQGPANRLRRSWPGPSTASAALLVLFGGVSYVHERHLGIQVTNLGTARGVPLPRRRTVPRGSAWTASAARPRPARAPAIVQRRGQRRHLRPGGPGTEVPGSARSLRRATALETARPRMARLAPARVSAPRAPAWMGCVARAPAMAPACPATRPVGPASARPTLSAAIQK